MPVPETRYAKSGDLNIAYQVSGDGPFDLVFVPGYVTHLELHWDMRSFAPNLEKMGSFSRLIRFDKRGTGMSDRVSGAPTLEALNHGIAALIERGVLLVGVAPAQSALEQVFHDAIGEVLL